MFYFVENESAVIGHRVARGDGESLNQPDLVVQLKNSQTDVLKLHLSNTQPDLYVKLNGLRLPYYVLGITVEYKSIFTRNEYVSLGNNDLEFREYLEEHPDTFKNMVDEIFRDSPASFYINPDLVNVVDEAAQRKCLVLYVSTLNRARAPHLFTHLIYYKKQLAGFICSHTEGQGGGATYGGILPQYQNKGLYLDVVRFIQNFGKELGQKWGTAQAQLQNTVVQKTFQRAGLFPSGYNLNVHINAFYGKLNNLKDQLF